MMRVTVSMLAMSLLWAGDAFSSPEWVPMQDRAQGQSLTGANLLNDSLYSNPAASAFTQVYSVEGMLTAPKDLGVSVLDTRTSGVGGGVGYYRHFAPGAEESVQGARLSVISRLGTGIGGGISGKMVWGPGEGGVRSRRTDFDVGVLANFEFLQLGLMGRNVMGGHEGLGLQREWSAGGRLGYLDTIFFSAGAMSKWEQIRPYQVSFGAEYVSPYYFSIKGGYRIHLDGTLNIWTAGLSFLSPRMSVHYAVEFPHAQRAAHEHTVGVSFLM